MRTTMTRGGGLRPSSRGVACHRKSLVLLLAAVVLLLAPPATAAHYAPGALVALWANKIGPYTSPTESYSFYDSLAWCQPETLEHRSLRLGEALSGDHLVKSPYVLPFGSEINEEQLCEIALTAKQVDAFIAAIRRRWAYEMLFDDDLPMKLFVGEASGEEKQYLYTHVDFDISYNGDQVIEASASPGNPVELVPGTTATVRFTYAARWLRSDFPYKRRAEKYNPSKAHDKEIHWFSIFNSMLSVFLLIISFASILLRVVRRDVRQFSQMEEGEDEDADSIGWKHIYGDVFRFPHGLTLMCAFLGTGVQLLVLSAVMLILGALELFHPLARGTIYTAMLCSYALTAWIAGYTSGYAFKQMGGHLWIRNALATVVVFCGPVGAVMTYLHTVALVYQSTRAVPLWTIASIALLWAVVTIPLTLLGAIVGKNQSRPFPSPCNPTKIPREIPGCVWYRSGLFMFIMCGLMPFSSIYLEIYALFSAIWGHRVFQIYELLAIVFVILNLVTVITTVAAVYFQLAVEDYQWWWNSFLYGGSVGAYVMAYSVFYYYLRSPLEGFMQGSFFFGYTLLFSYAFFLMCGTVGFFSARTFVLFLYRQIKND
jgi:Endomembrane protein 70